MNAAAPYVPGPGGLPCRTLRADGASALLCRHGAQLLAWQPAGEHASRLYLSGRAELRAGAAIRGGVPVIFPQFAAEGALPRHGFARSVQWSPLPDDSENRAGLFLDEKSATHARWPRPYRAELHVQLQARTLEIRLDVHNTGTAPVAFTAALHSYLAVDDLDAAAVHGLAGLRYRDSARGGEIAHESAEALRFGGEIDRIYFDAPPVVELHETGRRLRLEGRGFRDCVVWNPGAAKAAALADLDIDGHRRFVCIEAATIGVPVRLAAGERWSGTQILEAA